MILSNSTEDWPDELGRLLIDPDFKQLPVNKTLANDLIYLNRFVGSYKVTIPEQAPQTLQISIYGKNLVSQLSGGEVGMLYPESDGVFGVKGFPDGKVTFNFDDQNRIIKLEARLSSSGIILWEAVPDNGS